MRVHSTDEISNFHHQEKLYRLFDCITIEDVIPDDLHKFFNFLRNPPACPYTGRPAFGTPKWVLNYLGQQNSQE